MMAIPGDLIKARKSTYLLGTEGNGWHSVEVKAGTLATVLKTNSSGHVLVLYLGKQWYLDSPKDW